MSGDIISQFSSGVWVLSGLLSLLLIAIMVSSLWYTDRRRKEEEDKLETAQSAEDLKDEGPLFKLYNAQLRIYQNETRGRARLSFAWAVFAMMVGFVVLAVGGSVIVVGGPNALLSGSSLAAIGGALSAFITKTLLDVHKVSLIQLNRYFKQPVLNSHVLTCQRLIKAIPPGPAQEAMYKLVIQEVIGLLSAEQSQSVILDEEAKAARWWTRPKGTAKGKEVARTATGSSDKDGGQEEST
jgi:hypothetical protein